MTTFADSSLPRYTHASSSREGGLCHDAINEKTLTLRVRVSCQFRAIKLVGYQPTGKRSNVFGFTIERPLICLSPRSVTTSAAIDKLRFGLNGANRIQTFAHSKNNCAKISDNLIKIEYNDACKPVK